MVEVEVVLIIAEIITEVEIKIEDTEVEIIREVIIIIIVLIEVVRGTDSDLQAHMNVVGYGSHRLHIRDRNSRQLFLIDTGSDVSIVPVKYLRGRKTSEMTLYASNNTKIKTYGEERLNLNLGLKQNFLWSFCVADVPRPILGADFLSNFGLMVDLKNKRLVDPKNQISIQGELRIPPLFGISTISSDDPYSKILSQYPEITQLDQVSNVPSCDVFHKIKTFGPPAAQRARRLPPDKLKVAKKQFREMVRLGICRPSKSSWATPILMKKKKDGSCRICGDFCRLNAQTYPDKYPVPNLQDMSSILHSKKKFSKIDLHMAYHQIPIAPDDMKKTAVITPFGVFEYLSMTFGLRNAGQTFQSYPLLY